MPTPHDRGWPLTRLGGHATPEQGVDLVELVGLLAEEPFGSYPPPTLCPVIGAFASALNQCLADDDVRAALLAPLAPGMVGTAATPEVARRRSFQCVDLAVRTTVPLALEQHGRGDEAAPLRALPPIRGPNGAIRAHLAVRPLVAGSRLDRPPTDHACRSAAQLLWQAGQRPVRPARIARASGLLFDDVTGDPRHWANGAALVRALCATDDGDEAAPDDPPPRWPELLAFVGLADDVALAACSTDAALAAYWDGCTDPAALLALYSRTGDRAGLVRAATACARAAARVAAPGNAETSPERSSGNIEAILAIADAVWRGEPSPDRYADLVREALFTTDPVAEAAEDDAGSSARMAAIAAVRCWDEPDEAGACARHAADARAYAQYDWDAPSEALEALQARARSTLAQVVRAEVACPRSPVS
ncbi:MAG: hypothetical protein ABMB14_24320 [Myxococcota bacterium]